MSIYGNSFKYQREASGLTQSGLAKAVGISQQKISYYESGKHEPPITDCVILADFYGITIDELIGRDIKQSSNGVNISGGFNNNKGSINIKG